MQRTKGKEPPVYAMTWRNRQRKSGWNLDGKIIYYMGPFIWNFQQKRIYSQDGSVCVGNKAAEAEAGISHRETQGDILGMMDNSLKLGCNSVV